MKKLKNKFQKIKRGAIIGGFIGGILGFIISLGRVGITGNVIGTGESFMSFFILVVLIATVLLGAIVGAFFYSLLEF